MTHNIINAYTGQKIQNTGIWTGDGFSYEMLPENTKIWFQPIDSKGNNIKLDGSIGNQIVGPGVILDQRVFKSDILYYVKHLDISQDEFHTKASLIRFYPPEESQISSNLDTFINVAEKNPEKVFPLGVPENHEQQIDALKKFSNGQMSYSEMRYHCG